MKKTLKITLYCEDCKMELEPTETGIMCRQCGGFVSDKDLEFDEA